MEALAVVDIFRGKALNPIDAKDRVSVPAEFRSTIQARARRLVNQDGGFNAMQDDADDRRREGKVVLIVRDTKRKCLVCFDNAYSRELLDLIEARHADQAPLDRESAIRRDSAVFADPEEKAWDAGGRIVLPAKWRGKAGIEGHAVFLALGKTFEIWDPRLALVEYADNENIVDFITEEMDSRGVTL